MINYLILLTITFLVGNQEKEKSDSMKWNKLNEFEESVIINKGTEMPFSGEYYDHKEKGIYVCKQCETHLFNSNDKFDSHCGWPSFDDEIKGAILQIKDPDGIRIEIICANCKGHLGHVFYGEGFTNKDKRHCVNSTSMKFISEKPLK